jgi:hypothetical protein
LDFRLQWTNNLSGTSATCPQIIWLVEHTSLHTQHRGSKIFTGLLQQTCEQSLQIAEKKALPQFFECNPFCQYFQQNQNQNQQKKKERKKE